MYVVVRRDSPFRRISDLKHRRIGLAPVGTHARVYERMIVEAYGLDETTAELKSYSDEEMASHLVDGTLDAAIFGQASIPERMQYVSRAVGIRVLDIGGDAIVKLLGRYPFFIRVMVTSRICRASPVKCKRWGSTTAGVPGRPCRRSRLRTDARILRGLERGRSPEGRRHSDSAASRR